MVQIEGSTFLVVDDEPDLRMLLTDYFEDEGALTITAADGQKGLCALAESKPDLVLVDLSMPELDGFGYIERARAQAPEVPIVVISGTGVIADVVRAVRLGAWDYIQKPIHDLSLLRIVIENVLEKAALQRENRLHHENLERLVAARTKELVSAKNLAEAAAEAKRTFLSNMNHEFRAPLSTIIMTFEQLRPKLSPAEVPVLDEGVGASRKLLTMLQQILNYAELADGRRSIATTAFDLEELLQTEAERVAPLFAKRQITFAIDLASDVRRQLIGGAAALRQALGILIDNAARYTEAGDVVLRVIHSPETATGGGLTELLFSVSDTGVGISPEKLTRIFEPFELGEHHLTKRYSGSGIGLALCSELVKAMGGVLWATSEPGKGSIFNFSARFTVLGA